MSNITDIAAVIISLCSFLFTVVVYFVNDNKIKKIQYEQLRKEQQREKQAKFSIGKEKRSSKLFVRFFNIGESDALNVVISLTNPKEEIEKLLEKKTDYTFLTINSGLFAEIRFNLLSNHPKELNFKLTWDDEFQKNNEKMVTIYL